MPSLRGRRLLRASALAAALLASGCALDRVHCVVEGFDPGLVPAGTLVDTCRDTCRRLTPNPVLQPTVALPAAAHTGHAVPCGPGIWVRITTGPGAARVEVAGPGLTPAVHRHLQTDVGLRLALAAAGQEFAHHRLDAAQARLEPWLDCDLEPTPRRDLVATAYVLAAHIALARGATHAARIAIDQALDFDPALAGARDELVALTDLLAEDQVRGRLWRHRAAGCDGGFAALAAQRHLRTAGGIRSPHDLLLSAQTLAATGATAAEVARRAQQARDRLPAGGQSAALSLLAGAAERDGDHELARELHHARALVEGPTPDVLRAIARASQACGDAIGAAGLLASHGFGLAAGEAAAADLAAALDAIPAELGRRLLARAAAPGALPAQALAVPPR